MKQTDSPLTVTHLTKTIRAEWLELRAQNVESSEFDTALKSAFKKTRSASNSPVARRAAANIRDYDVFQLIKLLRERFIANKDAHGARLPTEKEILSETSYKAGLSLHLSGIRRALAYLRDTQEISSQRGKGNTVKNSFVQKMNLYRKLDPLHQQVKIAELEIVSSKVGPANKHVNNLLKIHTRRDVLILNTLRKVELGKEIHTISMSTHYIKLKNLDADAFKSNLREKKSFTKAFKSFGVAWERKSTGIQTRLPTEKEAEVLGIGIFDPVLVTTGINLSRLPTKEDKISPELIKSADIPAGEEIEVTETIMPGHRWNLIFNFQDVY